MNYQIKLSLRYPVNDSINLAEKNNEIQSAVESFNQKNNSKKITKLISIDKTSMTLEFATEDNLDSRSVGRALSSFSRILIGKHGWNKLSQKENSLLIADYCLEMDPAASNSQQNRYETIAINLLELDRENPRIKSTLEMYTGEISEEQIRAALLADTIAYDSHEGKSYTGCSNLKESIKVNGGVIHPIIVNHDTKTGKHKVIEGNTRVQIYREFKRTNTKGNWDTIPAIIYTNLEKSAIDAIRLQAHLVGPRDWDPYSKAKYLNYLSCEQNLTLAQIVEFCGGNKNTVTGLIEAYNIMEEYYRPLLGSDDEFDKSRFSAFVEVQNKQIMDSIRLHGFTLTDFAKWIIDDKFSPLNTIRQLKKVLDNDDARKVFLKQNKGMREAREIVDHSTPITINFSTVSMEALARELTKRLRSIPYNEVKEMRKNNLSDQKAALLELIDELASLKEDIELPTI